MKIVAFVDHISGDSGQDRLNAFDINIQMTQ